MAVIGYTIDLSALRDIQTKLYTPPVINHAKLDGIFYKGQDFTQSHAQLNEVFFNEYKEANEVFPKSCTADELHSNLSSKIRVHSSGKDHFTTFNLSPSLRHFINDTCRLLEPFTPLLADTFSNVTLGRTEALSSYITKLLSNGKTLNFDTDYILELYEVWNDYKHRGTKGVHATAWRFEGNKVIKPTLGLPILSKPIRKLKGLEVDEFQNKTSAAVLEFLNFVI